MLTKGTTIGFVGTGVMGKSMAANLQKAGYNIAIFTRTKEKAQALLENGAVWKETIKDLSQSADVILTMVGYPSDVEEVYFGTTGILENAKAGTYVVDMTTYKPTIEQEILDQKSV